MNKFFLYGRRQVGKSTIVNNVLDFLEVVPSGFKTLSNSHSVLGDWDLYITDVNINCFTDQNRIASCKSDGSWEAYPGVFNSIGVDLLTFPKRPKIIIMDEIGFMEKDAYDFQKKVLDILDEPFPVLGVIKPAANEFMQKIYNHPDVRTFEITPLNRDRVFVYLTRIISKYVGNLPMNIFS